MRYKLETKVVRLEDREAGGVYHCYTVKDCDARNKHYLLIAPLSPYNGWYAEYDIEQAAYKEILKYRMEILGYEGY